VGTGGRVGKEVAERIRGPKDTCRAPGDHWVDVVRIPMDDDEMIDRGLGARANRRTAALVRLDGVGEVRRRGRTWQCGRHRSRTGPSGRCRGRMRRRRGHRGHMWLCGGGWHRGGGGGPQATRGAARPPEEGPDAAARGGAGEVGAVGVAQGDAGGAEAARGYAEGSVAGGAAWVGTVDEPVGKGGTTVGDTWSRSRDTSRSVREAAKEEEEKGKFDSSKTT
jgi:hypothetical protein